MAVTAGATAACGGDAAGGSGAGSVVDGGLVEKRCSADAVDDPRTLPNSCPPGGVADGPDAFENDRPAVPPRDGDGSGSGEPGVVPGSDDANDGGGWCMGDGWTTWGGACC